MRIICSRNPSRRSRKLLNRKILESMVLAQPVAAQEQTEPATKKKKVNPYKIQQVKLRIERLEGQIQLHETRVAVLNQMLASEELYRDHQLFRSTMEEHDKLQHELEEYLAEWENLHSELDDLQN